MYLQLLLSLSLSLNIFALPNGAPRSTCETLEPFHGGGIPAQDTISPFIIFPQTSRISENARMVIAVKSLQGIPFQGFMLQARDVNGRPIGRFLNVADNQGKSINCLSDDDSVTHVNTDKKNVVEFEWEAPGGYLAPVVFNATVAQGYSTFWVGIESPPVQIAKRSLGVTVNPGISTRFPARTSTPRQYEFERNHVNDRLERIDPIYTGCNEIKSCFGAPSGCVQSKDCRALVTVLVRGDRYEFELKANSNAAYVAVGLSDDDKMGDDSTIECVRDENGINAYSGYTVPRSNLNAFRLAKPKEGVILLNSSYVDGSLYCKIVRDYNLKVNGRLYNLRRDTYNLLIAAGTKVHPNKVSYHDIEFLASGRSQSLADVSEIKAASRLLTILHGSFMIVAWIGLAPIGIMLARYYRQTWVGRKLCGKDHWFAWHRLLMMLTWVLTIAGVVLMFVELGTFSFTWSTERNPHALIGIVTLIVCFFQPVMAFFRPHPNSSKRGYFNWGHWLAGNVAQILAVVAIFFAVKLSKAELPDWMDWILVGFVAFHVFTHLLLSLCSWLQILGCISDKGNENRVTSFPMKEMPSGRGSMHMEQSLDAPGACFRKFLFTLYTVAILLIVIVLVLIVVFAPVEETLEMMKKELRM